TLFAHMGISDWPSCEAETPECPQPNGPCIYDDEVCDESLGCNFDSGAEYCLQQELPLPCHEMTREIDWDCPNCQWWDCPECDLVTIDVPDSVPPDCIPPDHAPPPQAVCDIKQPQMHCGGRYPWFIYDNVNGQISTTGRVKYEPAPLESETGDSAI